MRRSLSVAVLIALVAVLLGGAAAFGQGTAGRAPATSTAGQAPAASNAILASAASSGTPYAQFDRMAMPPKYSVSTSTEANRYTIMVMVSADNAYARSLKAAHPGLKILMYQTPMQSQSSDPNGLITCTGYKSDLAHPSWFLHDQHGHYIHPLGDSSAYAMDIGNPSYQAACLSHATSMARADGFNGIFWDEIETDSRFVFPSGVTCPEYPTGTSYYNAFVALMKYAGPTIRAAGQISIGNLSAATPAEWQTLTTPMDGSEEESWTDGGLGPAQQAPYFAQKLANVAWSEAHGKLTFVHSYNTTETGNTYGLAAMMLIAGGHTSYSTSNSSNKGIEYWFPEYNTAESLGAPLGAYFTRGGIYIREFQNGVALVNPTTRSSGRFMIDGRSYTGSGLKHVTWVTMAPTSGLVMLRDPVPASTASPPPSGGHPATPTTHKAHKAHKTHKKHRKHKRHKKHKHHAKTKGANRRKHHGAKPSRGMNRALAILATFGL